MRESRIKRRVMQGWAKRISREQGVAYALILSGMEAMERKGLVEFYPNGGFQLTAPEGGR